MAPMWRRRALGRGCSVLLLLMCMLHGSSQSSALGVSVAGESRLEITPAQIRAGESFTISLRDLTPQERNLSSITISLSSSKLNEEARLVSLGPEDEAPSSGNARREPTGIQIVQRFSARVSTVRSDSRSRPDLQSVNVVPGTTLDVVYLPPSVASSASLNATNGSHSNSAVTSTDVGSVQVALEPSVGLPPFAAPGQYRTIFGVHLYVRRRRQSLTA